MPTEVDWGKAATQPPSIFTNCASLNVFTPSFPALSSFEPVSSPTLSVTFALIDFGKTLGKILA